MKLKSYYHLFEIRFQVFILLLQFRQSVICNIRLSIRGILKKFLFKSRSNLWCVDIGLPIMIIKIIIRLILDPMPWPTATDTVHCTVQSMHFNTKHRTETSLAFQSLRQTFTFHFFLLSVSRGNRCIFVSFPEHLEHPLPNNTAF